jgi:hypothetical protein
MKLKNSKLIQLDKDIYELNRIYGLLLHSINSVPNLLAIKNIIEKINLLNTRLEKISSEDEFENIFIRNHLLNLEGQGVYLEYLSTRKAEGVDDIAKMYFGDDAMKLILDEIKNFDYKADWDYYLSYQDYSYRSYPSDSPELQDRFREILEKLKIDILDYARKHYGLDKDYDFDLVLGQPYSNGSSFAPSTRRVEISPNTFFAYKEEGRVNINSTSVIQVIFHEFIGHALQEFNSSCLPSSVKDDSINTAVLTMTLHAEGFAQMMDEFSIKFMKEFQDDYGIKDDYIFQRELGLKRRSIQVFFDYYMYLKLKNMEDAFDYGKKFLEETGNFGLFTNYEMSDSSPFGFFKSASYFIGLKKVRNIYEKLISEFGLKNESLINKSISMGLFNIEVLEDFARYYIGINLKKD